MKREFPEDCPVEKLLDETEMGGAEREKARA
jgi:hypothetical protein